MVSFLESKREEEEKKRREEEENKRREEEEEEEEEEKFAKGKDFYDFWHGSLVLYGISMVLGMELCKDF